MAKSDIIASLKLNSTDYEQKLAKAKESTRKFSKEGGQGLTDMVGKFKGIAVAVAGSKAVMETFNAVIKSSQTIGDGYTRVVDSMKTSTNQFFYSIGSGDWTAFFNGLDDVIAKSRAASRAIDDLGTYDIALGYFREKYQTGFKESVASAKDTKNSDADRKAAAEAATQYAESYAKALDGKEALVRDAFAKILANAGSNIDASRVSIERFERVLEDAVLKGNASAYEKDYKEYQSLMEEKRKLELEASTAAINATKVEYARQQEFRENAIRLSQQAADIERRLQAEKYQDAQMYNVALERWTDDELKGHLATASGIEAGRREVAEMRTALIEVTNAMAKLGTTTATVVAKTKELKTSLTGEQLAEFYSPNVNSIFTNDFGRKRAAALNPYYEEGKSYGAVKYNLPIQDVPIISDDIIEESLPQVAAQAAKVAEESYSAADGIYAISNALGNLSGIMDDQTTKWFDWGVAMLGAIGQFAGALSTGNAGLAISSGTSLLGGLVSMPSIGGELKLRVQGSDLVGSISNYNKIKGRSY